MEYISILIFGIIWNIWNTYTNLWIIFHNITKSYTLLRNFITFSFGKFVGICGMFGIFWHIHGSVGSNPPLVVMYENNVE